MPMEVDVVKERLNLLSELKECRTNNLISEELYTAAVAKTLAEIEAEVTE